MIHLISIEGKAASDYYLERSKVANLQTVIRGLNAGRSLIISTCFRSDLLYYASEADHKAIMKLWAMHAQCDFSDLERLIQVSYSGDQAVLDHFFLTVNKLSTNRYKYRRYQKAFEKASESEPRNPILQILTKCDQYQTSLNEIRREPLMEASLRLNAKEIQDTFAWSMSLIRGKLNQN